MYTKMRIGLGFGVQLMCFSAAFPANRGFTRLGRTTVITSTLSHKQMAKQMILAHLTQDHPYLFHGCWPTVSPCLSLLHECSGREMAADTHTHTHTHVLFPKQSGHEKGSEWGKKKKQGWPREKAVTTQRWGTMERDDGLPSKRLNNFTFINDSSKSMCCCELLFMSKILVDAGWHDLSSSLRCQ